MELEKSELELLSLLNREMGNLKSEFNIHLKEMDSIIVEIEKLQYAKYKLFPSEIK